MAAVISLDPSGNIAKASPYIQNCTSANSGACGMQIDGNLHKKTHPSLQPCVEFVMDASISFPLLCSQTKG